MNRLLPCFVVLCLLASNLCAHAQSREERAILRVLAMQEAAWNKADIPGYMQGYWADDSLVFLGKKGPTYGYTATLNNYLKSYPDTAHTGHLDLSVLRMQRLGARSYHVIGKWQLQRSAGDVGGYFDLVFRKIRKRWLIVFDHTS
jgi:ketosteroid isomerase-like protein